MNSMPFDFEPLALDFPALTLQCLQPPPTLFSSLQHSTTTSWSISPPGHQQYEALCAYFKEEFRKWRIICETTTTAVNDDIPYPPPAVVFKYEAREAAERALRMADSLERQVEHHVQSTYATWQGLPAERQGELWVLELARSVGKKQHEIDSLKETQHSLKQVRSTRSPMVSLAAEIERIHANEGAKRCRTMRTSNPTSSTSTACNSRASSKYRILLQYPSGWTWYHSC